MARSLDIDRETIKAPINGATYYIKVTVDGADDNASFTATSYDVGDWFNFSIERKNNSVYLKVVVQKNLSTQERHGSIILQHNCVKISKIIEINQDAVEYEIIIDSSKSQDDKTESNVRYHSFKSMPTTSEDGLVYEEQTIKLTAKEGRGKWYVKEVKQYQVSEYDTFKDEDYKGIEDDDKTTIIQDRTTYDNVFNYHIEDNSLVVRSYGQIDLTNNKTAIKEGGKNPYMRYYFVVSHSDVDNDNKIYMDEKDVYKNFTKRYEDKILFVFDGKDGSGYTEDDSGIDSSVITPEEGKNYVFLINNSTSPIINVEAGGEDEDSFDVTLTIESTLNGNKQEYTATVGDEWLSISGNTLTIKKNSTYDVRQGAITFIQEGSNKEIILTIAQNFKNKGYVFTVNGQTENVNITIENDEETYTENVTVESKYGDSDTPYTAINTTAYSWITYNDGKFVTNNKNTSYENRVATFLFKQTNSNKQIYVTIQQKGITETNEFEVYFSDSSSKETTKSIAHTLQTLNITVISTHNGVFAEYTGPTEEYSWLKYNDSEKEINVAQYSYDGDTPTRTATLTFTREINGVTERRTLTIKQEKQEGEYVCQCNDDITVGWEGQYYKEPYGSVYSYMTADSIKYPVGISVESIDGDDFIEEVHISDAKEDYQGYYYEITLTVKENLQESIKNAVITFTNNNGKTAQLKVEQRKNGEVILTAFDYIVMNYNWTDYYDGSTVYDRDFDCVMYFDTPAIGDMNNVCAYYSAKTIPRVSEGTIYAELAYDQIHSSTSDLDRIETQVVYLAKLFEDGYLQKIKEASEKYLKIQLYGNLYNVDNAEATPESERNVTLSIHTYKGGTMEKDDDNKTMVNVDGEEVNVGAIQSVLYNITALNQIGGMNVDMVKERFQHLGTIEYNVRDKSAVFTPVN